MPLEEIQITLARLYTERHFREGFFKDRLTVLHSLSLSSEAREFFLQLDQESVRTFARQVATQRFEELARCLPLTRHVLGSSMRGYFQSFYDTHHQIEPNVLPQRFLGWLVTTLKNSRTIDSQHYEMLRYEYAKLRAREKRITARVFRAPLRAVLAGDHASRAKSPFPFTLALWIHTRHRLREVLF